MTSVTQELTSYHGGCHCGAVTFTVRIPSLSDHNVNRCNCSICSHNGYLLVYPKRTDVDFHTGYDTMISYCFGDKMRPHKFCPTCGSSVMIEPDGRDIVCLNVSKGINSSFQFANLNIRLV
jgi:hypothetical protein